MVIETIGVVSQLSSAIHMARSGGRLLRIGRHSSTSRPAPTIALVGQLDLAITDHEYPPTVWAVGEVVPENVQIGAANLQSASYAVWMGMYARVTQMRCRLSWAERCVPQPRATGEISSDAVVIRSTAGMPGSCRAEDGGSGPGCINVAAHTDCGASGTAEESGNV